MTIFPTSRLSWLQGFCYMYHSKGSKNLERITKLFRITPFGSKQSTTLNSSDKMNSQSWSWKQEELWCFPPGLTVVCPVCSVPWPCVWLYLFRSMSWPTIVSNSLFLHSFDRIFHPLGVALILRVCTLLGFPILDNRAKLCPRACVCAFAFH